MELWNRYLQILSYPQYIPRPAYTGSDALEETHIFLPQLSNLSSPNLAPSIAASKAQNRKSKFIKKITAGGTRN
jgi:hypothetical protein